MEIFNAQRRHFDESVQRSASNDCVRLIRKLRWIGASLLLSNLAAERRSGSFSK
jgi:hypothetical protein